jgi:predicted lipoprotein
MPVFLKMKRLVLFVCLAIWSLACSKKDGAGGPADNGFDKTAMLTHYADQLIIPGYGSLQQKFQSLETPLQAFMEAPTTANQELLKSAFKEAYLQFERVSVYQFGPAEAVLLNNFLNTFPANPSGIENKISSGTFDLTPNSATQLQGFPALDYLLFSSQAPEQFAGPTDANRKRYVQEVFGRMKTLVNRVVSDWNGGYRAQFIANTRTDVGSPIGYLINQFAYELDQLKGPRIGWPFGKQSGGQVFADKTQAYYSGFSVALALENLMSLQTAYTGDNSGKGMSDYLVALKKEPLNAEVLKQFDLTLEKLRSIPDPLSASLTSQPTQVNAAYREIQKLLTFIKTDVASATAVRITYQDSDGD